MNRFSWAMLHVGVLLLPLTSLCVGAERAASIEYEFVERPAGLQADFVTPQNAKLRFLAIKAMDGFRIDAALAETDPVNPASSSLIVSVHGSGGRYDVGANAFVLRCCSKVQSSMVRTGCITIISFLSASRLDRF